MVLISNLRVFAILLAAGGLGEAQTVTPERIQGRGSSVATWAAPAGEKLSEDYTLRVNGRAVPVYSCRLSAIPFNQVWPGYQRPLEQTELAGFAYWGMSGPVTVEVISKRPFKLDARFRLGKYVQDVRIIEGGNQPPHLARCQQPTRRRSPPPIPNRRRLNGPWVTR